MNRDAANAAAAWWAGHVQGTRPEMNGLHEAMTHREAFTQVASIGLRGLQLENATPVTDEMVQAFRVRLAERIEADDPSGVRLFTDYGPCQTLGDAADDAGLDTAHFPQKMAMTVRPDHITAKAGYGQPWRLIWSAPGWQHPPCGVQEWPDGAEDPIGPECAHPRWHDGGHDWED